MKKYYKIYSLESNTALYGILHGGERDQPTPQVLCEISVEYHVDKFVTEESALNYITLNKERLRGMDLVILPYIYISYSD